MAEQEHNHDEDNPLQGYFDWQVTTLMLAHEFIGNILGSFAQFRHEALNGFFFRHGCAGEAHG